MLKIVSVVLALAAVVGWVAMHHDEAPRDEHFYRFKLGLTYKNQPIDIDIVVGCSVHYSWSRAAGGSTNEVASSTGYFFASAMPEGHAIVVRTSPTNYNGPCHGDTTANGQVDPNWLPLIAWYERDDDFGHGITYATQDAYDNPNARFGFRGATIEHADRGAYDRFVATGRKNLWPPYLSDSMSHTGSPRITDPNVPLQELAKHPTRAWPYMGDWYTWPLTSGVRRIKLTKEQREIVRQDWPADHPKYWGYETRERQRQAFLDRDFLTDHQKYDDHFGLYYADPAEKEKHSRPEIYPILAGNSLVALNANTPGNDRYVDEILISATLRGFEYTDFLAPPKLVATVTGKPASEAQTYMSCHLDGYVAPSPNFRGCRDQDRVLFENDAYAIVAEKTE